MRVLVDILICATHQVEVECDSIKDGQRIVEAAIAQRPDLVPPITVDIVDGDLQSVFGSTSTTWHILDVRK